MGTKDRCHQVDENVSEAILLRRRLCAGKAAVGEEKDGSDDGGDEENI